ncbi:hypothetical protein ACXO3R_03460, partial [Lactobacillus delbrueckii subsp. bulgaricus]
HDREIAAQLQLSFDDIFSFLVAIELVFVVGELEVVLVSLWKPVFSAFYLVHLGFHSVQISFQSGTLASLLLGLVVDMEIVVSVVIRVQLALTVMP